MSLNPAARFDCNRGKGQFLSALTLREVKEYTNKTLKIQLFEKGMTKEMIDMNTLLDLTAGKSWGKYCQRRNRGEGKI